MLTSDIAPFTLFEDTERPWMNAVDALAEWWTVSEEMGLQRYGYVFRSRRFGSDEVSVLAEDRMVCTRQYSPPHICTDFIS